jgi:hypothetical protein
VWNARWSIHPRYDATVNHPAEAAEYRQALVAELGDAVIDRELPLPIMASEDFSYYLKEVPGAFALIGADDGNDHHHPCHSAKYDFNDRLIAPVAAVYARLAGAPVPPDLTPARSKAMQIFRTMGIRYPRLLPPVPDRVQVGLQCPPGRRERQVLHRLLRRCRGAELRPQQRAHEARHDRVSRA